MIGTARLAAPFAHFIQWWLSELYICLPAGLRNGAGRRHQTLFVEMAAEQAIFRLRRAGACKVIGQIDIDHNATATMRAELAKIRRRINLRRADIILCFQPEQVLHREVTLPLAATENLREVLAFEMDRHTPFHAKDVYFDYRLNRTDKIAARVSVDLVAMPRAIADRALRLLQALNLPPDRISVANQDPARMEAINLLPPETNSRHKQFGRRLTALLALTAGGLMVASVALEFRRQEQLLATYESALEESRASGLEAEAAKKQVADLLEHGRYVVQQKRTQRSVIELLSEVTHLLPDNTWVSQFRLQGDQLVLSGYSPAASTLVGLLEESPMLAQLRFASPVTLDPKLGVERFDLAASVVKPVGEQ